MQGSFWLSPSVSVTLERGLKSWQRLIHYLPQEPGVVRPTRLVLILLWTICWLFFVIYAAFWFREWTLTLNIPHGRRVLKALGAGWSTEGQCTLAGIFWWLSRITKASLIHSIDLQSYRCPPDAAGSLCCPLARLLAEVYSPRLGAEVAKRLGLRVTYLCIVASFGKKKKKGEKFVSVHS